MANQVAETWRRCGTTYGFKYIGRLIQMDRAIGRTTYRSRTDQHTDNVRFVPRLAPYKETRHRGVILTGRLTGLDTYQHKDRYRHGETYISRLSDKRT